MQTIPRDPSPESGLALLREGYRFISNRCDRFGSDLFLTRLMMHRALCMRGAEAARLFYDDHGVTRQGALPVTTLKLLQDKGSVQMLDDEAHRWRKRMFMTLMGPPSLGLLDSYVIDAWWTALVGWERRDAIVLHEELHTVLCRAACGWAGVPVGESELAPLARDFAALIDGAGAIGPRNWAAMAARRRIERWALVHIEAVRAGARRVEEASALAVVATHLDENGRRLEPEVAAVELVNLLRPTVAVANYALFAALALHEHADWRERLAAGDDDLEPFVQEVRRFYPFFPAVGGIARRAVECMGELIPAGTWMLLDIYGTLHHPRLWQDPDRFDPQRFYAWRHGPYTFIPQGGGDHATGHRCPGEWITVMVMKRIVRLLTRDMIYEVPPQDLGVDLGRFPALPASRLRLARIRRRAGAAAREARNILSSGAR